MLTFTFIVSALFYNFSLDYSAKNIYLTQSNLR